MNVAVEQRDGSTFTVNRILALSPMYLETSRRNFSRIYIVPTRESLIDSILFQGHRSMEEFIPAVARAISEAGLSVNSGVPLQLKSVFDSNFGAGVFQSHIQASGWLIDNNADAFDLFVELDGIDVGELPEMITYDANISPESDILENPLCIKLDIEAITPSWEDMMVHGSDENQNSSSGGDQLAPRHEPEVQSGKGQVKNPDTDRRLKENRNKRPEQLETARKTQNSDSDTGGGSVMARQAGKPGRVRMPALDGRLKENRRVVAEATSGGR
jgi:hypothetical protein